MTVGCMLVCWLRMDAQPLSEIRSCSCVSWYGAKLLNYKSRIAWQYRAQHTSKTSLLHSLKGRGGSNKKSALYTMDEGYLNGMIKLSFATCFATYCMEQFVSVSAHVCVRACL